MKLQRPEERSGRVSIGLVIVIAFVCMVPFLLIAAGPPWWIGRNVLNSNQTNDYAPANLGQLKSIATAAFNELNSNLPGGVGDMTSGSNPGTGYQLTALINSWSIPATSGTRIAVSGTNTNDYAPVNLGQLKNVASLFYNRLIAVGYTNQYPWASSTNAANDYAMANIGQMKNMFSFDVTSGTGSNGGVPNWWESNYFGSGTSNWLSGTSLAPAGNGLTVLQDYQQQNDPTNYYSQNGGIISVNLSKVSGDAQSGTAGTLLPSPLVVLVTGTSGQPLSNAPVTFTVTQGAGFLISGTSSASPLSSMQARTGTNGYAQVWFQQPLDAVFTSTIAAQVPGSEVDFSAVTLSDTNAPAPPSNVGAVAQGDGSVLLTWADNSDNETGFTIQRSDDGGQTWVTVGTVGADVTSFVLSSSSAGINGSSQFQVIAASPYGNAPSAAGGPGPATITPIPTMNYAAIDISGSTTGTNNVSMIAFDDQNHAAFDYYSGTTSLNVGTWASGTMTAVHQISPVTVVSLSSSGMVYANSGSYPVAYGYPVSMYYYSGTSMDGGYVTNGISGTNILPGSIFSGSYHYNYQPNVAQSNYDFLNISGASNTGTGYFGTVSLENTADVICGWGPFIYYQGMATYFIGTNNGATECPLPAYQPFNFTPTQMNNTGWALGGNGFNWQGAISQNLLWNKTTVVDLSPWGSSVSLNDSGQVIMVNNGHGYLWQNGYAVDIQTLLPSVYQGEVSQITPLFISNADANNAYNIIFSGSSVERSGTVTGTFARTFLLNVSGTDTLNTMILPNGITTGNLQSINKYGLISAIGTPSGGSGQHALLLLPVEPTAPVIYMFSGHDSDTVTLSAANASGWTYQWQLKNSGGAQGQFQNQSQTTWSSTGTTSTVVFRAGVAGTPSVGGDTRAQASGTNTIQLLVNGTCCWEEPLDVIKILPRSSWGALAPVLSKMSGMSAINELTVHHSSREAFGTAEIQRIQKEHMGLLNTGWFVLHPHPAWGDIGYHFILDPSNDSDPNTVLLYEGRQLEGLGLSGGPYTIPSAVLNKNTLSGIDVCILGNYQTGDFASWMKGDETFSETRRKKLEEVLTALSFRYKAPVTVTNYPQAPITTPPISYHQKLASQPTVYETTECPGNTVISTMTTTGTNVQNDLK